MKLKLKEPPAPIMKVGDTIEVAKGGPYLQKGRRRVTAVATAPRAKGRTHVGDKRSGMDDERADGNVKEPPVKMRKVSFTVPDDGKTPRLALLNARHDEWLQAAGAQEGRTPEQFLDRLVRLAWSKDSTKGGKFVDKMGGDGHARGRAEHGHSGSHPASGNE